jgi:DNA-binding NarL/FixJ family response regulator
MEMMPKVLILEDDIVIANQMWEIFELSDFEVVGISQTCEEAIDLFMKSKPDLLVCCIYLNNGQVAINFVEEAREVKNVPVIYVSSHDDEETLNRAMDNAPSSYITKPFTEKQLFVAAKCAVHRCRCYQGVDRNLEPTGREMEIIRQLAHGLSTKEIANKLSISYETVKSHRKNIYKKFSVSSGTEAVALAYQFQWLS